MFNLLLLALFAIISIGHSQFYDPHRGFGGIPVGGNVGRPPLTVGGNVGFPGPSSPAGLYDPYKDNVGPTVGGNVGGPRPRNNGPYTPPYNNGPYNNGPYNNDGPYNGPNGQYNGQNGGVHGEVRPGPYGGSRFGNGK